MWRVVVVGSVLAGCGFHGPPALRDAPEEPPHDAPIAVDAPVDADGTPIPLVLVQQQAAKANHVLDLPFDQPVGAHHLIIAVVAFQQDMPPDIGITSVSDTLGDAFVAAAPLLSFSDISQAIYVATDTRAGTNHVTAVLDMLQDVELRIYEYSGLATASVVDATSTGRGTAQFATASPFTTTHAHDLLFAATTVSPGSAIVTPGTGFALLEQFAGDGDEMRIVTSTGTYTITAGQDVSNNYIIQVLALRGVP